MASSSTPGQNAITPQTVVEGLSLGAEMDEVTGSFGETDASALRRAGRFG
jgi:uncharacterized protein (DUF433 family)